jgi:hypothetical protein
MHGCLIPLLHLPALTPTVAPATSATVQHCICLRRHCRVLLSDTAALTLIALVSVTPTFPQVSRAFDIQSQRVAALSTELSRTTSDLSDLKLRWV